MTGDTGDAAVVQDAESVRRETVQALAVPTMTSGSSFGGARSISGSVEGFASRRALVRPVAGPIGVGAAAHLRQATVLVSLSCAEVMPAGRSTPLRRRRRPDHPPVTNVMAEYS